MRQGSQGPAADDDRTRLPDYVTVPPDPNAVPPVKDDPYKDPAAAPKPDCLKPDAGAIESARFNNGGQDLKDPNAKDNIANTPSVFEDNKGYPCDRAHRCDRSKKVIQ